jgi:hypothetical protein
MKEMLSNLFKEAGEGLKKQAESIYTVFADQFKGLFESLGFKGDSESAAGANDKLKGMSGAASKAGKNPPGFPSMG